jgi:hypothetical protein
MEMLQKPGTNASLMGHWALRQTAVFILPLAAVVASENEAKLLQITQEATEARGLMK